jgi:hypothetical protein
MWCMSTKSAFIRRKGYLFRDELGMTACARAIRASPELVREPLCAMVVLSDRARLQFSCYESMAASKLESPPAHRAALCDELKPVRALFFHGWCFRSRSFLQSGFFWRQRVPACGGSKVQSSADLC